VNFNEEEQGVRHNEEDEYITFQKWQREFDQDYKTVTWLDCEAVVQGGTNLGTKVVRKLKCTVCARFRSQILYKQNFSYRSGGSRIFEKGVTASSRQKCQPGLS